MATKQPENKRQAQAAKLSKSSTRNRKSTDKQDLALREHYQVIKEDIIKLREDLNAGYAMAKGLMVDRKSILRGLMENLNR